jgi:hypothetical protein
MDKAEILARLRSILDEATETFYDDDTELYPALSLAQIELVKAVADNWKVRSDASDVPVKVPKAITPLLTTEKSVIATTNFSVAISGSPIQAVSCQWQSDGAIVDGSPYAVELAEPTARRMIQNTYLANGIYYWYTSDLLTVNPVSSSGSAEAEIIFIDTPVDITASVDPETDAVAHDAIVERASWILLKDRETEQAQLHLQMYGVLLEGLLT